MLKTICSDNKCETQTWYPHYDDDTPIPTSDTRVNWHLEDIKHRRGNKCWSCENYLTPFDLDHSFCNPCWDHAMEHYFESDESDLCVYCGEVEEHKSHLEPEPYVPDYMDDGHA